MISALRSKFWRTYSDSKGIREAEIQFTDRYEALGIPHPDPATMCLGQCEGTGTVPVCMGREANTPNEDTRLVDLWRRAEAEKASPDGWHFVKCPECEGTGKRISEIFRVSAPGRKSKTFATRAEAEAYKARYPGGKLEKISSASHQQGGHPHPHDQDGLHSHPGLPTGGGHGHTGDGSHRHRPEDPLEGAHSNEGQGYHEHPLALASMTEAKHEDLQKKIKEGVVVPAPIGRRLASGKATGSLWPRENQCFGMWMILVQDSRALGFIRHNPTPQNLKRSEAGELKAQHSMSQEEVDRRFPKSESLVLYKVAEFVPIPGSPVVTVDVPEDRIDPFVKFKEGAKYAPPELADRCDFEVVATVNWIRSEESKPIETKRWSDAERREFKEAALKEAGLRGLFSVPKK